jgi:hypothetical protein
VEEQGGQDGGDQGGHQGEPLGQMIVHFRNRVLSET